MALKQDGKIEGASYTLADALELNTIKNRLRDVTRTLDAAGKSYPDSIEARQLKHEVIVLLSELQLHGLLPDTVSIVREGA